MEKPNLIGQRFGRLTVLEEIEPPPFITGKDRWYKCLCDCGNVAKVRQNTLRQGLQRSCGCLRDKNPIQVGQRFGRLTVLEKAVAPAGLEHEQRTWYKCRCDCGNVVVKRAQHLKNGNTKSCGCLQVKTGRRNLSTWAKNQKKGGTNP